MTTPKLKIHDSPSEQLIQQAAQEHLVSNDRISIKLKKPGVLAQFRMIEALGDLAKNEVYTGMVLPLIFINEIDGVFSPQPATKGQIEALIQQLDEDGLNLVVTKVQEVWGKQDAEADKENIKK